MEQVPINLQSEPSNLIGVQMRKLALIGIALSVSVIASCATMTVRQDDLDAWVGQPVLALETHPVFLTMTLVKTTASDGTEIWNFVNGVNIGSCAAGGGVYGKSLDFESYNRFTSCVSRFAACNNIFFIKDGTILRYTPVGSGGMGCYTTAELQPKYNTK